MAQTTWDVLVSDPPWRFANWSSTERATRGEKWGRARGRSPYDVMDTEDIAALPVADVCHRDTLLFLWATGPKLEDAFQVMKGWGFEYTTMPFTWVKLTRQAYRNFTQWQAQGKTPEEILAHLFHAGNGYWTMANTEFVMLGKRKGGKMPRQRKDIRSLVVSPVGSHSRKPLEVNRRIQRLLGPERRYLELFARPPIALGFDAMGLEVSGKDIRVELEEAAQGVWQQGSGNLRDLGDDPADGEAPDGRILVFGAAGG